MRSLQNRLSISLTVALIALAAVLLASVYYSLRHLTETFVAARIEHDLDSLLANLRFTGALRLELDANGLGRYFQQPYSGHYYKVVSGDQVLRSRSLWDTDLEWMPPATGAGVRFFTSGPRDQQLLVLVRDFTLQGQPLTIAISEDFTPLAAGLRRLMLRIAVATSAILALLLFAQRWVIRHGLRPLEAIRRDIVRLSQGDIRQLSAETPHEIRPLVLEINHLISAMHNRVQRSRHALGNLAHALKTPLALLVQAAEREHGALGTEVTQHTAQIQSLVSRELKRARIAGSAVPGQRVMLAREVEDLVATLNKLYQDKALDIQLQIPALTQFPGDRDDLLELLGNLLDNACQWANSEVRLSATETAGHLCLTVEDDGPGCSEEELAILTQRGARLDEMRAGHGLGLAIVTDIVEQYGGRLQLGRSTELGGLLAQVELPRAGHDLPTGPALP